MTRIHSILQRTAGKLIAATVMVTLLVLLVSNSMMSQANWISLDGPFICGNVKDISFHSGGTVYAADGTRLLKSTNSGTVWRGTGTDILSPLVVHCNPDVAGGANITVSGTNFVKNSGDGGLNWTDGPSLMRTNLTPLALVGSPITTSEMWFGRNHNNSVGRSVWKSVSSGSSWDYSQGFSYQTDVTDIAPYPTSGVGREGWVWACGTLPAGQANQPKRGLFRTFNGGTNWTETSGASSYDLRSVAVIHQSGDPHLYVARSDGKILKSTNLGDTWSDVLTTNGTIRRIRINSSNNYIFVASSNGVYRSVDEGQNWSQVNSGIENDLDVKSMSILNGSNTLYIGTAKSVYKSTNNGNNWVDVGVMNTSSVASSNGTVWGVTQDNASIGKYNGTGWTNYLLVPASAALQNQHVYRKPDDGRIFVAGSRDNAASLFRSTDGGANFTQVSFGSNTPSSGKFMGTVRHAANSSQLWVFGGGLVNSTWRTMYSSTDGGTTWTMMTPLWDGTNNNLYVNDVGALDVGGASTLYAALSDGKIYKSGDNGASWTLSYNIGGQALSVAVNPNQTSTVYVAGTTGVWKTTNGGVNWSQKRSDPTKRVIVMPGNSTSSNHATILSNDENNVYCTVDGGATWVASTWNLPTPINDLRGENTNPAVVYAATAKGIFKLNPPAVPTLTPLTGSQPLNALLQWTGTNIAGSRLVVDDNQDFSSPVYSPILSTTSFNNYYLDATTYYWKTAAFNPVGETDYAAASSFTAAYSGGTITISKTSVLACDGQVHPKITWTSSNQCGQSQCVNPTFSVYRIGCLYGQGFCGTWPYTLIATTTASEYTDCSVVLDCIKGQTPTQTYYYEVRASNKSGNWGTFNTCGVWKESVVDFSTQPAETRLRANYPNPFNPTTEIAYSIAAETHVRLIVHDILGREIATLVNEVQSAGEKTFRFDASGLPSGVYYYRLHAGTFTDVKKMVLAR